MRIIEFGGKLDKEFLFTWDLGVCRGLDNLWRISDQAWGYRRSLSSPYFSRIWIRGLLSLSIYNVSIIRPPGASDWGLGQVMDGHVSYTEGGNHHISSRVLPSQSNANTTSILVGHWIQTAIWSYPESYQPRNLLNALTFSFSLSLSETTSGLTWSKSRSIWWKSIPNEPQFERGLSTL